LDDVFNYQSVPSDKPICCLTFDDAWYDFYTNAFPLLKKYKIPATLFVPTHFIGTDKWFWTDRLAQILFRINSEKRTLRKDIATTALVDKIMQCNGSADMVIQNAISLLKSERKATIEKILDILIKGSDIKPETSRNAFVDWHQLAELAASEHITIGSHTDRHLILTNYESEEILAELQTSKQILCQHNLVNPDFIPFCYPNGNFNQKISQMVADTGYDMAVTTQNGWNQFTAEPFTLKRIGVHEDISSSSALLSCRLARIF
jgi:peptidoglycan/xylan/chitin deacetylase (PgdA/CDA1 family)